MVVCSFGSCNRVGDPYSSRQHHWHYQHQALARHQIPRTHPSVDSASAFKAGNHNDMHNVCGLTDLDEPAFRNLIAKAPMVRIS